jgi:hypothetical protein
MSAETEPGLERGERATVAIKESDVAWEDATEDDCREVEVFDHVTVTESHYVNSVNGYETWQEISAGDDPVGDQPDAVTKRVADLLWHEFSINVEKEGIEVVDVASEDTYER